MTKAGDRSKFPVLSQMAGRAAIGQALAWGQAYSAGLWWAIEEHERRRENETEQWKDSEYILQ